MPQLFRPSANTIARVVLVGILVVPFFLIGLAYAVMRSPYTTGQNITLNQPVPFSHKHHVGEEASIAAIATRRSENSPFAGLPPTTTCMTCHSQLCTNAPMLAPVRASLAEHKPIHWQRVHRLPGLRLFRSLHPHRKRRRLHHLPRPGRDDAADAAGRAAHHGLVPGLSPQSGAQFAPAVADFQHGVDAAGRSARTRAQAARSISHRYRTFDGLLAMPPVKRTASGNTGRHRSPRRIEAAGRRRRAQPCRLRQAARGDRALRRATRARGAGRAAALCHHARSFRLRPRRHRDVDGGAADQDRRQSAPSGKSRRHRCVRRSRGDVALRSRPLQGGARREQCRNLGGVPKRAARADGKGSIARRRGLARRQRPHHLADARAPARRAAQAISAGALVSLRAGDGRFRHGRRAACVRPAADGAAALCRGRGRAVARCRSG